MSKITNYQNSELSMYHPSDWYNNTIELLQSLTSFEQEQIIKENNLLRFKHRDKVTINCDRYHCINFDGMVDEEIVWDIIPEKLGYNILPLNGDSKDYDYPDNYIPDGSELVFIEDVYCVMVENI